MEQDYIKEAILKAFAELDLRENTDINSSTIYDVVYNDKKYPPKEVYRLAKSFIEELYPDIDMPNLGGGKPTNNFIKKHGFKVVEKGEMTIMETLINDYKIKIKKNHLKGERYKWELLNTFSGRPNLKAENLLEELKSIDYSNLLYAMSKAVIKHLTSEKPDEVHSLLSKLFDENIDLNIRVKSFNKDSLELYRSLGETLQHHQDERTISTYLTFHNPKKYTFYKYSFYKSLCELMNIKQAKKNEKYAHYLELVNQIIDDYIENDNELIELVKAYLPEYYDGTNHLLLVQDILYQMLDNNGSINYWVYAPGEKASKWEEFYQRSIMGLGWDDLGDLNDYPTKKAIKKKLQELESVTTSKQNDTAANYEFLKVMKPGDIIIVKKGISELLGYGEVTSDYFYDTERTSYQKCREVDWQLKGNWKVDFNLPLKTLTNVTKYKEDDNTNYYDKLLSIMKGDLENNIKVVQNYNAPLNQIFYGPPGTGKTYNTILEAAKIIEQNDSLSYNEAQTIFNEHLGNQLEFITFHQNYSYEDFIQGLRPDVEAGGELSFFKSDGVFKKIADRALKNYKESNTEVQKKKSFSEVFEDFIFPLVEGEVEEIEVKMKKVSFYITNIKDKSIEFRKTSGGTDHTLSIGTLEEMYEDESIRDIKGLASYYRPLLAELLNKGKLDETEHITRKNYVIIIDEINRANISRVFGELITLIEKDKRFGGKIPLTATLPSGEKFIVPSNLYIIGTMNTADKSIALLDIALRRRFEFVPMYPNSKSTEDKIVNDPIILDAINNEIISRKGHDFTIGHSYFMGDDYNLNKTIDNKVIPLLLEYFMNDFEEVKKILGAATIKVDGWPLQYVAND